MSEQTSWAGTGYTQPRTLRQAITDELERGPKSLAHLQMVLPALGGDVRDELRSMTSGGQLTIQPPSGNDGLAKYRLA